MESRLAQATSANRFGYTMTPSRKRRIGRELVVAAAFLIGMSIGFHDRYCWRLTHYYGRSENAGCALARAYARQFQKENGRRPSMEELIPWAESRFAADLSAMTFDPNAVERQFDWKRDARH